MPHIVDSGRDIMVHPIFKSVRVGHIDDGFRAREEQGTADVAGDIAQQLAAEARDLIVIEGCEASKDHWAEGKVDNKLINHTCNE